MPALTRAPSDVLRSTRERQESVWLDVPELRAAMDVVRPLDKLPSPQQRKEIRCSAGVTLEQAAMAMGISTARLEQWEDRVSPRVHASFVYRKLLAVLAGMN